ncbi:hypothetical protein [Asticcacaulis sp. AND118]|uniref:hypothetical protein n=1 Tax=Asticcacaulis sp. AND118 TaxID=2840468 RepID=UPI001CFFB2AD|nr:hypothetical protein [Asticcacaulis sp. AND118]UDF03609.1 hypothetical protein LH365_00790 [Asticcacaulis sp. AND118]
MRKIAALVGVAMLSCLSTSCAADIRNLPGEYKTSKDNATLILRANGTAVLEDKGVKTQYRWMILYEEPDCTRLQMDSTDNGETLMPCAVSSLNGPVISLRKAGEREGRIFTRKISK